MKNFIGKIEQLEKIKLIEELNLSEDVAIKFFARRNSNKLEQKELMKTRNELYKKLNKLVGEEKHSDYKKTIDEIMNVEEGMLQKRKDFIYSLDDILTQKQIAQLILFEYRFRKEMRHQFIKQGQRRMMKEN